MTDLPSPPRKWLLAYRLLGLRLPDEYRQWVVADTRSKWFLAWRGGRSFLWLLALIGLFALGYRQGLGEWPPRTWLIRLPIAAAAVALFSSREQLVRRTLRWHRMDKRGNPVATPKRLARIDNREAALLGVMAIVVWTAGSTAFGYGMRPTGVAAAPCREADPAVFDRITTGATGDPKYLTTRMVRFEGGDMVLAIVQPPNAKEGDKPSLEAWLVRADGVFRIVGPEQENTTTTKHPRLEGPIDRIAQHALQRAAECLAEKPVR